MQFAGARQRPSDWPEHDDQCVRAILFSAGPPGRQQAPQSGISLTRAISRFTRQRGAIAHSTGPPRASPCAEFARRLFVFFEVVNGPCPANLLDETYAKNYAAYTVEFAAQGAHRLILSTHTLQLEIVLVCHRVIRPVCNIRSTASSLPVQAPQ